MSIQHESKKHRKRGTGTIRRTGYLFISKNGRQRGEHTWAAEEHLGRPLAKNEVVHHLNGNKRDNRINNLIVVTKRWHKLIHKDIGKDTRFSRKYNFDDQELTSLFYQLGSAERVAAVLGCQEMTAHRALKRVSNYKSLILIKKELINAS